MHTKPSQEESRSAWDSAAPAPATRVRLLLFVAIFLAVIVAAFIALTAVRRAPGKPVAAPVASSAAAESVTVEFEKLKGKWLRPDGGYVIELKRLLPNNDLEAAYFNPNPIHVGKAKLYKERGFTKVFIELQDVNYPGSTYTLIYDVENDRLCGTYYQATQQQEYQIEFTRMPPGS